MALQPAASSRSSRSLRVKRCTMPVAYALPHGAPWHLGGPDVLRLRALSMAALCPGSLGQGWLSGNLFPGSEAQPYQTAAVCLSRNSQTRRREANSSLLRSCLAKRKRRTPCCPGRRNPPGGRVALPRVPAMGPSLRMRKPWRAI